MGWLFDDKDVARPYRGVIGSVYVVGIVGFYLGLYPMTDPTLFNSRLW